MAPSVSSATVFRTLGAHRGLRHVHFACRSLPTLQRVPSLFSPDSLQTPQYGSFASQQCLPSSITQISSRRHYSGCACHGGNRKKKAYIALGSNMGDRIAEIEKACNEMDRRGIRVKRTSSLWETEPMYVLDQDAFLNGACEVCSTGVKIAVISKEPKESSFSY